MAGETPENIQLIGGRIRSQKVRNCILCAPRTAKELHWPFGDALLFNVTVLTRIILRYVLKLRNEGERCFCTFSALGKRKRLRIGRKRMVVVTAVFKVGRPTLRVAPDAGFQNIIPNLTTASFRQR